MSVVVSHLSSAGAAVAEDGNIQQEPRRARLSPVARGRNYLRRQGWGAPPIKEAVRKFAGYVTWPYFPSATYDWTKYPQHLPSDLLAGVTVGIMLIPQGLAYSQLAALPPIYGLYASTVAGYVYAVFGTSGQLTIGPVALTSLFMSETFRAMGVPLTPSKDAAGAYATYVRTELAAVVSLAAGIILCALAFLRVGGLMRFISPSVLIGFVTGSGVYIFLSQAVRMFGIKVPRSEWQYQEYRDIFHAFFAGEAQKYDTILGVSSFVVLFVSYLLRKRLQPRLRQLRRTQPGLAYVCMVALASTTLVTIVIMTLVTKGLVERGHKVKIVGQVPAGFNAFQLPAVHNEFYGEGVSFAKVLWASVPVAFLTYMESLSMARKYAIVNKYPLDASQELWALGLGCTAASFFQAYPPGGSFARTALKADIGVKTPMANIVTSLFATIVLVAATELLEFVPMAVLGAVICTSILTLWDFGDMWRALWVAPLDFLVMAFTFTVSTVWSVEKGLIYGLIASIIILLVQISRLDMDSIGQLKLESLHHDPLIQRGTKVLPPYLRARSKHYPGLYDHPHVKVLRLTANLFFGNVTAFRDEFYATLATESEEVRAVIVDAAGVAEVDLSALAVLDEMTEQLSKQGILFHLAGAHDRVVKSLEKFELLDEVGGATAALDVEDVFVHVVERLDLKVLDLYGSALTEGTFIECSYALEEFKQASEATM